MNPDRHHICLVVLGVSVGSRLGSRRAQGPKAAEIVPGSTTPQQRKISVYKLCETTGLRKICGLILRGAKGPVMPPRESPPGG